MDQSRQGQFLQADFFENTGGINTTDSPFRISDNQATGGYNFDYALQGGFEKRPGYDKLNESADSQLKTLGLGVFINSSNTKTVVRGAGTKIQKFDPSAGTYTNLTEDTQSAGSDFLSSSSTQPFVTQHFDNLDARVLWGAGAGIATGKIYGVFSTTKVTENGVAAPTGSISLSAGSTGGTIPVGTYYYAIAYRKASTLALSNASLDDTVTVASGEKVTVDLSGITGLDTTKMDKIYIYRSSAGGSTAFTAGTLVAIVNSSTASYEDDGTVVATSQNVPRAGNTLLDNSQLPSTGTYKVLATFQRRLVTASGNTLYYSDLNKGESWPSSNYLTLPTGGDITALAVLSFSTPTTQALDEILIVFKEREMWIVRVLDDGSLILRYIDAVGCVNQPLARQANGFLYWIDYRGIYAWQGSGKPIYLSRPIESMFQFNGDLDKSKLSYGWAEFFRKKNQVYWHVSSLDQGEQKLVIKLDLRLTLPRVQEDLSGSVIDGVFILDSRDDAMYAGVTYIPDSDKEEVFYGGDNAGNVYSLYYGQNDDENGIDFSYETKFLDFGSRNTTKRYHKVIVWTENSTTNNLTIDWWCGYSSEETNKATLSFPISTTASDSRWDAGFWDIAVWDSTSRQFNPIVFNLYTPMGTTEGECLKLRFRQSDADAPITIAGFSVVYTEMGLRK
jgi:hypothetical protein